MVEIKEMLYSEKYSTVLDNTSLIDSFVTTFVRKHLGDQALTELNKTRQTGGKPIPEDAAFEEKYEIAYSNWIWTAKNAYSFIRSHMDEEGLREFQRADVEALKRENAGPALWLLRLIRAVSPSSAFKMVAKKMAYSLQWMTPYTVSELTQHRAVFDIPRCKILDFPGTDHMCQTGCQGTYPMWVAEQFNADMKFEPRGHSCVCTVTPMSG